MATTSRFPVLHSYPQRSLASPPSSFLQLQASTLGPLAPGEIVFLREADTAL